MATVKAAEIDKKPIAEGRTRYLAHGEQLMMAVIDFNDGPTSEPDPPHHHPHEQVTYVASGEVLFFLDGHATRLQSGDMFVIPPNVPHTVQLLTGHVRLIDTFTPLRDDFL